MKHLWIVWKVSVSLSSPIKEITYLDLIKFYSDLQSAELCQKFFSFLP